MTPDALAQICSRVGLSDAAELMALAPARQPVRALDASVWKTPRPGLPEVFDPRELLEWLPVWLEIGDEFTAERLGGDDPGGARCPVATSPERLLHLFSQLSGDESMLAPPSRQGIAGQAERPPSNRESDNRDFASQREATRERRGHVSAAGAQAFLALAAAPVEQLLTLSHYDLETSRHLAMLGSADEDPGGGLAPSDDRAEAADEAELTALRAQMEAAGLVEPQEATLLLAHQPTRVQTLLVQRLARMAGENPAAFDTRARELAYLAGVLIAAIALQGEKLTAEEARAAALATCNLGLELLEKQGADARIDQEPGLVRPFLVGWQALGQIPRRVAEALARSLARLQASAWVVGQLWMLDEAVSNVAEVRAALSRRDFAAAREAALLLAFVLDPHACRAVLPLLDELPHLGGQPDRAAPPSRQAIAGQAERPPSRQGIAGQAERPQWIQSLADLRGIGGLLRKLRKRRSPPRV